MSPSELFLKIASLPAVLVAAFVFVVTSVLFFRFNPTNAIEARFKDALNHDLFVRTGLGLHGPRKLYAMLDAYTDADYRAHYKSLYLDFIYPLIYSFALALIIVHLQNHFRPPDATVSPYPVLLPLAAAVADYLENLCQLLILRRYQAKHTRANALVIFSVMMTAVKILLWLVSVLLIIAGLLKLAFE
jgi:hypothetical protein